MASRIHQLVVAAVILALLSVGVIAPSARADLFVAPSWGFVSEPYCSGGTPYIDATVAWENEGFVSGTVYVNGQEVHTTSTLNTDNSSETISWPLTPGQGYSVVFLIRERTSDGSIYTTEYAYTGTAPTCATACKEIYFVSVRGSGQEQEDGSPQTRRALAGLDAATNKTIGFHEVQYPAASTDLLTSAAASLFSSLVTGAESREWAEEDQREYQQSVLDGVTALSQFVAVKGRDCPTSKFVLAGYSQGAMSIHEYLNNGAYGNAGRIAAAVLIADPMRLPNRDSRNQITLGSAAGNGYGLCRTAEIVPGLTCLGYPARDVPSTFRGRTYAVCDNGDIVCDTSAVVTRRSNGFSAGMAVHSDRYQSDSDVYNVGRTIGVRLNRGGL